MLKPKYASILLFLCFIARPDEPKEAPEEDYDHRSLFERLEEQRQKKQMEFEEEHKFKNQFRLTSHFFINILLRVMRLLQG